MDFAKETVFQDLKQLAEELHFQDGFKLIYDRWDRINDSEVIFLSLNPGRAPEGVILEEVSDERGNSYIVEQDISKSPINRQFVDLFYILGIDLDKVLAGVYIPFRSDRLRDLTCEQKSGALNFSRKFWLPFVKEKKLVICCGKDVFREIHRQLFPNHLPEKIPSGWGKTSIEKIFLPNRQIVLGLPHLSSHKLLSKTECRTILSKVLQPG
jgi:hypothetical protein